jgi:hypothetical protein
MSDNSFFPHCSRITRDPERALAAFPVRSPNGSPTIRSGTQALSRWQRRLIVPRSQPVNADTRVTAEKHDQPTSVVLGLSQVVQQELANAQLVPRKSAALGGAFVSQPLESFVTLSEAMISVIK